MERDELYKNQRVVAKTDRFNQDFIGIEQVPWENKVELITHAEISQYAIPFAIEQAYSEQLKTIKSRSSRG